MSCYEAEFSEEFFPVLYTVDTKFKVFKYITTRGKHNLYKLTVVNHSKFEIHLDKIHNTLRLHSKDINISYWTKRNFLHKKAVGTLRSTVFKGIMGCLRLHSEFL